MLAADDESSSAKVGAFRARDFHGGKNRLDFPLLVFHDERRILSFLNKLKVKMSLFVSTCRQSLRAQPLLPLQRRT